MGRNTCCCKDTVFNFIAGVVEVVTSGRVNAHSSSSLVPGDKHSGPHLPHFQNKRTTSLPPLDEKRWPTHGCRIAKLPPPPGADAPFSLAMRLPLSRWCLLALAALPSLISALPE